MAEELHDKLIAYIQDAVALEEDVERMLDGMIGTTADPELRSRLERHQDETRAQQERLRARLEAHGASESGMKDFAARMGAAMKGMFDGMRGDKAGRNASDGYTTEHMEIAAYRLLEQVAIIAGDEETAEVARTNRREEEQMAQFLDTQWEKAAGLSLEEAGALT